MMRQMRRFEVLLPAGAIAGRVTLPHLQLPGFGGVWRQRWFWFAVMIFCAILGLATWIHTDERWFIYAEDVHFNGLHYLAQEELFSASKLDGWNIFWIDPNQVSRQVRANPYVMSAAVHRDLFGARVTVDVVEARPVAWWVTDLGRRWLLDSGLALEPRGDSPPGLMEILDKPAEATAPGAPLGSAVDPDVLVSAQALVSRLPGVAPLRYQRDIGLNFLLPGTPYWVYWGDGANAERKLEYLAAGERLLDEGKLEGNVIDVRFDPPYVK